jgi:hypothetical protein
MNLKVMDEGTDSTGTVTEIILRAKQCKNLDQVDGLIFLFAHLINQENEVNLSNTYYQA